MRVLHLVWRAFRDAAWALILVFIFRYVTMRMGVRAQMDMWIHFSGGVAIAYFLYRLIKMASPFIGELSPSARFCFAYCAACTVAVFWEIGEFVSDLTRHTHIQFSVSETLWDQINGVSGAMVSLIVIRLVEWVKSRRTRAAE